MALSIDSTTMYSLSRCPSEGPSSGYYTSVISAFGRILKGSIGQHAATMVLVIFQNGFAPGTATDIFIKGNHEDFAWLESQMRTEVLPGPMYLRNGCRMDLEGASGGRIRVGDIGGCYVPSDYSRASKALQGYARRHYTHDEVDRSGSSGSLDLLLTHDAPAGIQFRHHRRGPGYVSDAVCLDILLGRVQPLVCVFGRDHARVDAEVAGVRCIGLNKIACPGNLVAIDIDPGQRTLSILAEYPALDQGAKRLEALEELTRLSQELGLGY